MQKDHFIKIIKENQNLIYKICYSYCSDPENRKDIEQEILVQLWSSFSKFDRRVKISTWIYRIALNTAISFYRKDRTRNSRKVIIDELIISTSPADDVPEKDENIILPISSILIIGDFQFSIPGLVGALGYLSFMILSFITTKRIEKLFTCDSNILEHQKELASLRSFTFRTRKFSYIAAPLFGLLIVPVFIKTISNRSIYDRPEFFLLICFAMVVGLILGNWLNSGVYDKGIEEAEKFLREIDTSEREEPES